MLGRAGLQDLPQRAGEDVFLGFLRDSTRVQHFVIPLQLAVELLQLTAEDVRAEEQLFESARAPLRRMRAGYARPPEDRFEECVVLLLLDERRAGDIEIQIRIPPPDFPRPG